MKKPDRHDLDLVARAVASGRRGHGRRIDRLTGFVAGLLTNRLAALGVRDAARSSSRASLQPVPAELRDRRTLESLFRRVEKHLAQKVAAEARDGGSAAR